MIPAYIIIFSVLLCSGLPIAFVLGITALIMMAFFSSTSLLTVPEVMFNSLDSFTIVAVPFFMIGAQFMLKGGTSRYLMDAINCYVRQFRGGLAIVCVLACMIFAAICGSSTATALAIGVIIVPAMMKEGYTRSFATGLVAASGTLGIMIPPSIPFIIYGIITGVSIPRLFLAGVMPGILEGALYIGWIVWYSRKMGYRGSTRATMKETLVSTGKATPALFLPVLILGGIYSGIVTVTEAAALFAVAAMVTSLFIYREIRLRDVIKITGEAMMPTGMILLILATAVLFGFWVTESGIPIRVLNFFAEMNMSPWVFLLFVNILFIIMGCFLEVISIMLITLPIITPVVQHLGIDLVHFGIVMTVNMELACITPPVGMNLFVLSGATRTPLAEVIRGAFPFFFLDLVEIAIITYIPQYCLFLPNLIMPK